MGDGRAAGLTFPPHTRGCTLSFKVVVNALECFPRTRGDVPASLMEYHGHRT